MSHFKANGELKPGAPSRHAKRPDVDNLAKYVLDSLQPQVLADDKCVVLCANTINQKLTHTALPPYSPLPVTLVPGRTSGRNAVRSKQSSPDGQQKLLRHRRRGTNGD